MLHSDEPLIRVPHLSLLGWFLAGLLPAQGADQAGARDFVRVWDHHLKQPLAGVEARLLHFAGPALRVLAPHRDLLEQPRSLPLPPSGPRGSLRFPSVRSGLLWLQHPAGPNPALGCLVPLPLPAGPGIPKVICRPMSQVEIPPGLRCELRWLRPGSDSFPLGILEPGQHRLPAGNYLCLLTDARGAELRPLRLSPGARRKLKPPTGPVRTVNAPSPDGRYVLPGWPRTSLPRQDARVLLPPESARLWLLRDARGSRQLDLLHEFAEKIQVPPGRQDQRVVISDSAGAPVPGARLIGLGHTGNDWLPRAQAHSDAQGRASLAWPTDLAAAAVIVDAPGFALHRQEIGAVGKTVRVQLERARSLQVLLTDGQARPSVHVDLLLQVQGRPLLDRMVRSDATGRVHLDRLGAAAIELTPKHPQYLESAQSLQPGTRPVERMVLPRGFQVHGSVLDPAGRPAVGVLVELRDTRDGTPLRRRMVLTDSRGRFRFGGLPEYVRLRLSARQDRGSRSLISKAIPVQPSSYPVTLELRSEDPVLPGRRR